MKAIGRQASSRPTKEDPVSPAAMIIAAPRQGGSAVNPGNMVRSSYLKPGTRISKRPAAEARLRARLPRRLGMYFWLTMVPISSSHARSGAKKKAAIACDRTVRQAAMKETNDMPKIAGRSFCGNHRRIMTRNRGKRI